MERNPAREADLDEFKHEGWCMASYGSFGILSVSLYKGVTVSFVHFMLFFLGVPSLSKRKTMEVK
jgi:hypothetical protein